MSAHAALIDRLRVAAPTIARRVIADTYQHPFWPERFGAFGRARADEDAAFHLDYVMQSLAADDDGVMRRYARWLQTLLTTRGMCTRHLDDTFARTIAALTSDIEGAGPAIAVLTAGREALLYDDEPARSLQRASAAVTERVNAALAATPRGQVADERARAILHEEVTCLGSYLADTVALGRTTELEKHVVFLAGLFTRHGVVDGALAEALTALGLEMANETSLDGRARRAAAATLAAAERALSGGAPPDGSPRSPDRAS